MGRLFTLAEAELLLKQLAPRVEECVRIYPLYREAEGELRGRVQRLQAMGGAQLNVTEFLRLKNRAAALLSRLQENIKFIEDTGCQVKDASMGLLDFPTRYRGRKVLLCWRWGEDSIAYWHGEEEGYRGRKPIDDDFLANHEGSAAS